ncbi:hypothetical protein K491DRAFT_675562 [Lophiostoma macrostomum CBS 122681]|uniref:Uncharacterized protein n=1 Tax=Lophiostoma macrostomum CBS 122681 TaxID=1314788 RepID=A0A6A6TIN7_9PLEO|nr:hypothetical protein K491DRAFT_675562 [Lophiostoma macrostomum CBS 122681]
MHLNVPLALRLSGLLGASVVLSEAIVNSTVPSDCTSICAPVVQLTNTCFGGQNMTNANNTSNQNQMMTDVNLELEKANPMAEMAAGTDGAITMNPASKKLKRQDMMAQEMCVCENKSFNVASIMGLCASCMSMKAGSGDNTAVKNVDALMSQCSFSSTSYAPSATSVLEGVSVQATMSMTSSTGTATGTGMANMQMGAGGRLEATVGAWSVGMMLASFGLGCGLLFGSL